MSDRPEDAGHGALFKNDRKEKPTHADYRGDVTIRGRKLWVSGWIKEGKNGKYLSLSLRFADEEKDKPAPASKSAPSASAFDL